MARKTRKIRPKWPYPKSLSNAEAVKLARRIIDEHGTQGFEEVDREDLAFYIWELAGALSMFERILLFEHSVQGVSFVEFGRRFHRGERVIARKYAWIRAKLKLMFERFGTQSIE